MEIGAIILAAGQSQRFGKDKRRAELPSGQTMLVSTIEQIVPFFKQTLVVLRNKETHYQKELEDALDQSTGIRFMLAPHSAKGMAHSLTDAMIYLTTNCQWDAVAIFLGDMPYLKPDSIRQLIGEMCAQESQDPIVVPVFDGRYGHPVIFHQTYFQELTELAGDRGAKIVIDRHPDNLLKIQLDDRGVIQDIDQPEDLLSSDHR